MRFRSRHKFRRSSSKSIPEKSNRILNLILLVMLMVVFRLWQFCVVDHDSKVQEALKPQQKVFVQPPNRGGIYDRFGIPMANNSLQYQGGIFYSPIRQIPSVSWTKVKGKKKKSYPRREYIEKLSSALSKVLHIDSKRIEDLIHAKASIRFDAPYILKEGLTEQQYYKLKMMEGSWPGVYAGIDSQRHYPQHKVAAPLLGYMGAINAQEYEDVIEERLLLEKFLNEWESGQFPPLPGKIKGVPEARMRLKELKEKSYSIYDWVGKSGLEAKFDEALKGYMGRQFFYSDAKGKFLKPLAQSQKSLSGKKLTLTISSELQKHAEELLIENERQRRSLYINPVNGALSYQKEPWIKGGAIAVLDPNSGEVLALASFPRYDPNDFIIAGDEHEQSKSRKNILKWLEKESYVAQVWNGQNDLSKEIYDRRLQEVVEDCFPLTWELYLSLILPPDNPVKEALTKIKSVNEAVKLQNAFKALFEISGAKHPYQILKVLYKGSNYHPLPNKEVPERIIAQIEKNLNQDVDEYRAYKKVLDSSLASLENHYDQLLLIDLCQLMINGDLAAENMLPILEKVNFFDHREFERSFFLIDQETQKIVKSLFDKFHFSDWRSSHQKSFLKEKRKKELASKSYPKPYIDYLDKEEKEQFNSFWQENRLIMIRAFLTAKVEMGADSMLIPYQNHLALLGQELKKGAHGSANWYHDFQKLSALFEKADEVEVMSYFALMRSFEDLQRPLYGHYRKINERKPTEKDLAKCFYPKHGFGFSRSYAFNQSTPQGSLFKLVTAYEALRQKHLEKPYLSESELNPLTIVDDLHVSGADRHKWNVGYLTSGVPIPQLYKGGRLPRSHRRGIGKIDLKGALEVSSNCYFGMLATDHLKHPEDLNRAARLFSYGSKTGLDLPGEISGRLPTDLLNNPTGLYAYSIGQHTLVVTPIQTALMLSAIANKGSVFKPKLVQTLEGHHLQKFNATILDKEKYDFKKTLAHVGIDFPLFSCRERGEISYEKYYEDKISRQIEMPKSVQRYLFKSMYGIVHNSSGSANPNRVRNYSPTHPNYRAYQELKNQIIGKTSSAEIREAIDLDFKHGINTYKHVWFGGIVFEEDIKESNWPKPELVVVVYLRYGDFGREAAPLVASIAKKWRAIKEAHGAEN